MSTVLIVGGGQGGLHLGNTLLVTGHEVTVLTDRDADQLRAGPARSTSFTAPLALHRQHADGLALPGLPAPPITRLRISLGGPHVPALSCAGALPAAAGSLDYRVSHSVWMELFTQRGGRVDVRPGGWAVAEIDVWAAGYDVVVVATGQRAAPNAGPGSGPASLFAASLAPFFRAQRRLSAVYVHGFPEFDDAGEASLTICPGLGELVVFPARTLGGHCRVVLVEALPGGPWDRFTGVTSADAHLESMIAVLEETTGRIGAYDGVELTDTGGRLVGEVIPRVAQPVGWLPSGRPVLALGDAAITMDPLAAQGGNQATLAASMYAEEIDHHDGPFDERWMRATWRRYWRCHGAAAVALSAALISSPLPPPLGAALDMASHDAAVATELAGAFVDPNTAAKFYDERAFAWWQVARTRTGGPMIP